MDGKRKGFLVALVIGLLAAPALALVASGLLGGEAVADEPPTTTAAAAAPATAELEAATTTTPAADLETACTVEGADLVAREAAGMLSELQQAALDSLRPICEAEGFSLEAAPAVEIEASVAAVAAPSTTAATQVDDDGDEAEYEDEGEYEDEDEYEDHEDEPDEDESGEYEDEG
jgi:hypothetical protein